MPFGFLAHKDLNKKSLKIPKGQSESVCRRRTDNTMAKRKSNLAFRYGHLCLRGDNISFNSKYQGRIHDFKLGGGELKKIAPSGGRRENIRGISCEKS
jgi:hypothetical protein